MASLDKSKYSTIEYISNTNNNLTTIVLKMSTSANMEAVAYLSERRRREKVAILATKEKASIVIDANGKCHTVGRERILWKREPKAAPSECAPGARDIDAQQEDLSAVTTSNADQRLYVAPRKGHLLGRRVAIMYPLKDATHNLADAASRQNGHDAGPRSL